MRCWGAGLLPLGYTPTASSKDLAVLTAKEHRLVGSPAGQAAGAYLQERLQAILGPDHVYVLDMPVPTLGSDRAQLVVDGQSLAVYPMQPNVMIPPVTPEEGLTGPLVYVGGRAQQVSLNRLHRLTNPRSRKK